MRKSHLYTILASPDRAAVRLGWVSISTGLTYCGICLRAEVAPEVGAECAACGARVSRVLDLGAGEDSIRQAWREALRVTAVGRELRPTGT